MTVVTGADIWAAGGFTELSGKSIGFVANHTSRLSSGEPTLTALLAAPGVEVKALFSPEHGAFGKRDEDVPDERDPTSGLHIYSLYGETRKPLPAMLAGLDALVFEVQDIGARFYTYASTLGLCLEAARDAGIPLYVLDRPNPISGASFEGPCADEDKLSFTAYHNIPVRHGLTLGELGTLYTREKGYAANAIVVAPCQGLTQRMWWDETGLPWIDPSPAMRSLAAATLYPGVCLLEQTNISVGRGTDTPFECIGAPFVNSADWLERLAKERIEGVEFSPTTFVPTLRELAGQECHGVRVTIVDRDRLDSVRIGIALITTLRSLYPNVFDHSGTLRLLANQQAFDAIDNMRSTGDVVDTWTDGLAKWRTRCAPVRLYR